MPRLRTFLLRPGICRQYHNAHDRLLEACSGGPGLPSLPLAFVVEPMRVRIALSRLTARTVSNGGGTALVSAKQRRSMSLRSTASADAQQIRLQTEGTPPCSASLTLTRLGGVVHQADSVAGSREVLAANRYGLEFLSGSVVRARWNDLADPARDPPIARTQMICSRRSRVGHRTIEPIL